MKIRSHNKLSNISILMETKDRVFEMRPVPEHLGSYIFSGYGTWCYTKDFEDLTNTLRPDIVHPQNEANQVYINSQR